MRHLQADQASGAQVPLRRGSAPAPGSSSAPRGRGAGAPSAVLSGGLRGCGRSPTGHRQARHTLLWTHAAVSHADLQPRSFPSLGEVPEFRGCSPDGASGVTLLLRLWKPGRGLNRNGGACAGSVLRADP